MAEADHMAEFLRQQQGQDKLDISTVPGFIDNVIRNPSQVDMGMFSRVLSALRNPEEYQRNIAANDLRQRYGLFNDVNKAQKLQNQMHALGRMPVFPPFSEKDKMPDVNSEDLYPPTGKARGDSFQFKNINHENTITIEDGGQWYNIPTVFNGIQLPPKLAISLFNAGIIRPHGIFTDLNSAVTAAEQRSKSFDRVTPQTETPDSFDYTEPFPNTIGN